MSNSTIPTTDPTTEPTVLPPTTESTTSFEPPTTSSTEPPTTSSTTSSEIIPTTSSETTTSRPPSTITSVITSTPTESGLPPSTIIITSTETFSNTDPTTRPPSTTSSRTSSTPGLSSQTAAPSSGLNGGGKIAVAVVVPIVAVALLILAGIFFWRKRKQRKDAEELRRKEVEEYGYNPNNDPSLPVGGAVVGGTGDSAYEMKEDGSSGYRGWGTTAVASTGRKASTTMSGPSANGNNNIGMAYSDPSPSHDARSDNPLVDGRSLSPEPETLGAMGPAASQNRSGDIHRGPSNASSSYSAANRSDGSGDMGGFGGGNYNSQYDTGNPYADTSYGSPPNRAEMAGQPVIRDVSARRNTRIENPSHFPQQSAGISQNF